MASISMVVQGVNKVLHWANAIHWRNAWTIHYAIHQMEIYWVNSAIQASDGPELSYRLQTDTWNTETHMHIPKTVTY